MSSLLTHLPEFTLAHLFHLILIFVVALIVNRLLRVATNLLSLSTTEAELLPQLRRGVALWKVGQGSFLVQHRLSHMERLLVNTDAAMGLG